MKTLWAEFGLEIGSLPGLQNAHYLTAQNIKNSDPSDEVLQRVRIGQDLAITLQLQSAKPLSSGTASIGLFMPRCNSHCHQVNTRNRNSEKTEGDKPRKETEAIVIR